MAFAAEADPTDLRIDLHHAGFELGGLGHHAAVPGWIEHEFNIGFADGRQHFDFLAHVGHQDFAHTAARSRQRHGDVYLAAAVTQFFDVAGIDEPEFNDIDWNFRIEAGSHLLPNCRFDFFIAGGFADRRQVHGFLAERVGILIANAEQIAFDENGEAATEGLGDVTDLTGRHVDQIAGRDHDSCAIALESDRFGSLAELTHDVFTGIARSL